MPSEVATGSFVRPQLQCPVCFVRLVPEDEVVLSSGLYHGKCNSCKKDVVFWSLPSPVSEITFNVNGTPYIVSNPDPDASLNEWIRNQPGLQGTKVMCHEGGCGCCVVSLTQMDPSSSELVTKSVNSSQVEVRGLKQPCSWPATQPMPDGATPMASRIHNPEPRPSEAINNYGIRLFFCTFPCSRFDGYHPIQERLADHNGSQCGYCSPGFVMNMYSFLKETANPSKQEIEDNFDGNICRCTGYRPILDAMKTFAKSEAPLDIEEIDKCRSLCSSGEAQCKRQCITVSPGYQGGKVMWYCPTTKADLYSLMTKHKSNKVRLVAGNTGKGIYKNEGPFEVLIDINQIKELHTVPSSGEVPNGNVVVGAGVSLNTFIHVLDQMSTAWNGFKVMADHIRKVANVPVRNVGSIAGNMMLLHEHPGFQSDIVLVLETIGASLIIGDSFTGAEREYTITAFNNLDMSGKVIWAVLLPVYSNDTIMRSYKVMPRAQNSHAYVNAGFNAQMDMSSMSVKFFSIVLGGIGPYPYHATKTEVLLKDKVLMDETTLKAALNSLAEEIVPDPSPTSASKEYRKSVAMGLFYKFYLSLLGNKASARVRSAADKFIRPVSSGIQSYDSQAKEYPLTKPMTKLSAKIQILQGNCKIDIVDPSEALKLPGVVRYITVKDIPKGGINSFVPATYSPEEIFCSGEVIYAGQALGIIVADTQRHADEAAKAVRVTYKEQKPPILTIDEAIAAKSFFDPQAKTLTKGDADTAIKNSAVAVEGSISTAHQYHFHMETQVAMCILEDDGITVHCPTQCIDDTQAAVAQVLNFPVQSVNMNVKRCGGAYGARLSRTSLVVTACALATYVTKRPVRMRLDLNTNMEMIGVREPYKATYKVGVTNDGKLNGIDLTFYVDCGSSPNEIDVAGAQIWADNGTFCVVEFLVKPFHYFQNNRWRKRGISVVPLKYVVSYVGSSFTAMVSIFHTDGTVAIAHGGIEVGQGINTKVAQVAAYELKCPMEFIAIKPSAAFTNPNSSGTGGSITSELCCKTVIGCCAILNKVIDPIRETMPSASWPELIAKCYSEQVDLSAKFMSKNVTPTYEAYNTYGVTCTEIELDVLTGEREILRTDILNDCGQSMNPELDVGQVEGAFMMGLGMWLTEKLIHDPQTGRNLTNGTWEYKPPCSKDIPVDFRVSLLKNAPNPLGVLRSKAVGEPPLCMSCASLFAVKHAVEAARDEIEKGDDYFAMNAPSTVERTQLACLVDPTQFTI
ncbi:PREDICTED: indole-3-acetaldehyde oxidase-like [Acropora digitifera]|uniref:indole-3-acetaldehyde oxidase-like n=1 Tax=Acropora digitifera TaxID=70779 RepID=UPI00077A9E16|nr:PREDICTED: indole-3-acetaldehyde oxidase-like [Acropora digitifera]